VKEWPNTAKYHASWRVRRLYKVSRTYVMDGLELFFAMNGQEFGV